MDCICRYNPLSKECSTSGSCHRSQQPKPYSARCTNGGLEEGKGNELKGKNQESMITRALDSLHCSCLYIRMCLPRDNVGEEGVRERALASSPLPSPMGSTSLTSHMLPFLPGPTRSPGMNRKPAYSTCITCQFAYTLNALHLTTSTAIKAVDDNQAH